MSILIINLGSETLKYKLFENKKLAVLTEGCFYYKTKNQVEKHFKTILKETQKHEPISKIGHRYVHGGTEFLSLTKVDNKVLKKLEKYIDLAPLHNPSNLLGINLCKKYFPKINNYIVFDTTFYKDLSLVSKLYAIPYKYYKKHKIQRFGFHGISHQYVVEKACEELKLNIKKQKIISIHLGGGCSVTAVNKGKAVDTSMGYTPLEGLVMMKRSGDIDAGVCIHLMKKFKMSVSELDYLLNNNSGLKGLTGKSDFLELLNLVKKGNKIAKIGFETFIYRIKKYIGSYYAILGGVDIIVFTGAIGYGSEKVRKAVLKNIPFIKNTKIIKIKPNEELAIAKQLTF